jgi:hypothetical protein
VVDAERDEGGREVLPARRVSAHRILGKT